MLTYHHLESTMTSMPMSLCTRSDADGVIFLKSEFDYKIQKKKKCVMSLFVFKLPTQYKQRSFICEIEHVIQNALLSNWLTEVSTQKVIYSASTAIVKIILRAFFLLLDINTVSNFILISQYGKKRVHYEI